MLVEIQVLPTPMGTADDPYRHVDAAIAVIQAGGLPYEVGALGTTFEGAADDAWSVARRAHEACLAAGAQAVVTVVKLAQSTDDGGGRMAELTAKFRER
jgi:uncharacterized protein YqgV (UPF0045/DUF77 family)